MSKASLQRLGGVLLFAAIATPPIALVAGLLAALLRLHAQA
jgi:hypothetical protein